MAHRFYTRRFLNKRGHLAGGYVYAHVENTAKRRGDKEWADITFTIADCGRQVNLDFDVSTRELANSLHKVDVLLETLTKFRTALVEEGEFAAEREVRNRENEKKSGASDA